MKNLWKRCLAAWSGLCLLCLYGCGFPDLFPDPEETSEEGFVLETVSLQTGQETETAEAERTVFVYVVGEVNHPGVYEVRSSDRLDCVIAAAGGFTADAEPASVNLARPVTDGEQIVVLSRAAYASLPVGIGTSESSGSGLVNINTAGMTELTGLPGIGQTRAQAIIDHRNKHGPFEKIEDIMQVNGIKQAAFEQIRGMITTGR